ncbi:MAG: dienelactone hydrolase family protein [Candidatus Rokuibacteriota bacterium]
MTTRAPEGYLAGSPGRLSVVVLHEAYGLFSPKSNVPGVCDRLAASGFRALAPDLYGGATATTIDAALRLARALRPEEAVAAVGAATARLRREATEPVAVLGFCAGGALAFRCALEVEGLCGGVVFYGTPRGDFDRLGIPVLAHFALRDEFVAIEHVRAAEARLVEAGKRVAFHYYETDHAFMNEKLPSYDAATAALAWERTREFLDALARLPARA